MSTLADAAWQDLLSLVKALGEAGLPGLSPSARHVRVMVEALRDPDAMRPDTPWVASPSRLHRLTEEKLDDLQLFVRMLEAEAFTVEELRLAAQPEPAARMIRALFNELYHEMITPPTTWNDGDYVALGPGRKLLASERTPTRAKEMALLRGCPTPLIVPSSRLKRRDPGTPPQEDPTQS